MTFLYKNATIASNGVVTFTRAIVNAMVAVVYIAGGGPPSQYFFEYGRNLEPGAGGGREMG